MRTALSQVRNSFFSNCSRRKVGVVIAGRGLTSAEKITRTSSKTQQKCGLHMDARAISTLASHASSTRKSLTVLTVVVTGAIYRPPPCHRDPAVATDLLIDITSKKHASLVGTNDAFRVWR